MTSPPRLSSLGREHIRGRKFGSERPRLIKEGLLADLNRTVAGPPSLSHTSLTSREAGLQDLESVARLLHVDLGPDPTRSSVQKAGLSVSVVRRSGYNRTHVR